MEELKIKGIVINSKDYGEKDKLVELFSLELGKIIVKLKGCKMPTSKLKFAYQPFCFAEFVLHKQGDFFTVINATLIDSFFDLSENSQNYFNSSILLEVASCCSFGEESYYYVFLNLLNSLKLICYENVNAKLVVVKFMLNILKQLGYAMAFDVCKQCKMPFTNGINLDVNTGEIVCDNCTPIYSIKISKVAFNNLRLIDKFSYDEICNFKIKEEVLKEILSVLITNFENRLAINLKSKKIMI